jgi:hypothetical protein
MQLWQMALPILNTILSAQNKERTAMIEPSYLITAPPERDGFPGTVESLASSRTTQVGRHT